MATKTLRADSARVTPAPSANPDTSDPAEPNDACQAQAVLDAWNAGQLRAPEAWSALLTRWNEVEAIPTDDATDEDFDLAGDLVAALLEMPSPNADALRWKLDYILSPDGTLASGCYRADMLRQTIADYRRMLAPVTPDAEIEAAWARRQGTFLQYKALPLDKPLPGEVDTPAEQGCLVIIDEAEEVIRSHVARTPQGAAIQLKVALYSFLSQRPDEEALTRGDLGALEASNLDPGERLVLAALRSLEAQSAACNAIKAPIDHTLPAVESGTGAPASALQHEWEIAARLFADTERAQIAFHDSHVQPVMDRYAKGLATIEEAQAAERAHAPYCKAHDNALTALTVTPAPTPEALRFKLNTAICEAFFDGSEDSDRALISIMGDVSRLLPSRPSNVGGE